MILFITELSHIVQIVHIVQTEFLFLIFEQKVLKQGWVKFSYYVTVCHFPLELYHCRGIQTFFFSVSITTKYIQ